MSLWNEITMGAGVGLTCNTQYRIADETTKFAMPEANIGFFVDVGVMHNLRKLRGSVGR